MVWFSSGCFKKKEEMCILMYLDIFFVSMLIKHNNNFSTLVSLMWFVCVYVCLYDIWSSCECVYPFLLCGLFFVLIEIDSKLLNHTS